MVKIINIQKSPRSKIGERGTSIKLINKEVGAKGLDVHINTLKPGIPGVYHYHEHAENAYIPIKGKGKLIVNGEEHIIDDTVVVFLEPRDKHSIECADENEFTMIEIYTSVERDYIKIDNE